MFKIHRHRFDLRGFNKCSNTSCCTQRQKPLNRILAPEIQFYAKYTNDDDKLSKWPLITRFIAALYFT